MAKVATIIAQAPKPSIMRAAISVSMLGAKMATRLPAKNVVVPIKATLRLPILSAIGPANNWPIPVSNKKALTVSCTINGLV